MISCFPKSRPRSGDELPGVAVEHFFDRVGAHADHVGAAFFVAVGFGGVEAGWDVCFPDQGAAGGAFNFPLIC